MPTQLFVPSFRTEECLDQIRECLNKGWTGLGFKTIEMEKAWLNYTGLKNAYFIASNTVGLHLAFHMFKTRYGWDDGDEVITTPITFVSTNHAILYERLKPVFADVDETLCLDPEDVVKKIGPRTRALIFVGIGGNTGRYPDVLKVCRERGIKVILDAAHMAGTRYLGKHVGHDADATVFSFQAVKNLPTADSGMICFLDPQDDERARKLGWLGINKDTFARTSGAGTYKWMYDVEEAGFKYHGNSIMAAIGLVQLRYLDQDNAYRRQLAAWYETHLTGAKGVALIPIAPGCESSRHLFQVRSSRRDDIMSALHQAEVYPGVHYRDNTEYRIYAHGKGTCPLAHQVDDQLLSLPMHLGVTAADAERISVIVARAADG